MHHRRLIDIERRIRRMGGYRSKRWINWQAVEVEVEEQNYVYQGQRMTPEAFFALPSITRIPRLVVVELQAGELDGD